MKLLWQALAGAAATACLAWAPGAGASCVNAPDLAPAARIANSTDAASGATRVDRNGRVVAPVMVNGQGPFRFIVDTGANRSVLSTGLAQSLGLLAEGMGDVHSIEGVQPAPMVNVASLNYGVVGLQRAALPILDGGMLGGEHGILGVDGMAGKRLRLDFDHHCIEIIPSRDAPPLRGWAQVRSELRFGHLLVVHGRVRQAAVNILIDTGSDISLANTAFRTAVQPMMAPNDVTHLQRALTAGRPVQLGNAVVVPRLQLGTNVTASDITAYIGDYHIFALWGMTEEPTILLGMDVLSHSHAIAIDYERSLIYVRIVTPALTRQPSPYGPAVGYRAES